MFRRPSLCVREARSSRQRVRPSTFVAVLTVAGLLLSACSGGGAAPTSGSAGAPSATSPANGGAAAPTQAAGQGSASATESAAGKPVGSSQAAGDLGPNTDAPQAPVVAKSK